MAGLCSGNDQDRARNRKDNEAEQGTHLGEQDVDQADNSRAEEERVGLQVADLKQRDGPQAQVNRAGSCTTKRSTTQRSTHPQSMAKPSCTVLTNQL